MAVVEVLRCPICKRPRDLSQEHTRRFLQGRAPLTACPECRHPHPHGKPTQADYDYWTSRMSLEEIPSLAEAIWL